MAAAHHPAPAGGFTARLKTALVGDPTARFVYLNNFEVERVWGQGEPRLPGTGLSFSSATVNRIEEVGVLLADEHDAVVLKDAVDPGYAAYLRALGAAEGRHLTVDRNDPGRSVTLDALDSPRLLAALRELADGRTHLMPLGISADEERLAEAAGLPLAGPSAAICKQVNGKVFSRELIDAAGLTQVPGTVCRTLAELRAALAEHPPAPGSPVVVKESLGVSGRGMVVLEDAQRAERLLRMLARRTAEDGPVQVVVERWIDKRADLNYQFVVGRDGTVGFETVKTALTENGVHRGHLFPPALRPEQVEELRGAAEVIGKELAAAGYFGLVGVDALLAADDTLYPCLEINARFNMATYQNRIAERLVPAGSCALATTFDLKPGRPYSFDELRAALGGLLLDRADGDRADGDREPRGVLINNFATLNATVLADGKPYGRLYAICVGDDEADVRRTRDRAQTLLTEMVATP
ncbi:ATP-grasp domain-containing protein [Kitasatospora paracochleata]|uniref:Glutathione synthase/RimK-type ligase-like ATP-grasp enzyme n=1 Tax=Kitasatospora paracochleata TaxID=58354 RepID=A0ABT1JCE3_9ACTN|nr:ATP-grasp domain-containing protein [Kitasatospora paracochleata]MCP2314366.1 glutathione synthase/RimK-type ligase-like ATP-grasp enzyme [Kitasatospora paracochleata]